MFLGISAIGWFLLAIVYVPLSIGCVSFWRKRWRYKPAKAFVMAVVLYVPLVLVVGEAVYVEFHWRALCSTARTEVKRKVVVDGFYDDGFRIQGWHVLQGGENGFSFVEWKDGKGKVWRTEGFNEPALRTVQIERPTARYRWNRSPDPTRVGHLLIRREESIVDSETGEVIALHVTGYRSPPLIDQIWRRWFDNVPFECGSKRDIWSETFVSAGRKETTK